MRRFFFTLGTILVLASISWAGNGVWTTDGPDGGRVESLAADPSMPGMIYAGTFITAFKSANGGDTWSSLRGGDENPLPLGRVSSLAASPDGRVYAGIWGSGLYWSSDGGSNWFPGNTGLEGQTRLNDLTVDPDPPHPVYLITGAKVYQSQDGGQSWVEAQGNPPYTLHFTVRRLTFRGGALYAANAFGVYKTSDGGTTWHPANGTPPDSLPSGSVREIAASLGGSLYAVTSSSGAYRSDDGGGTWQAANGTPPNEFPFSSRIWDALTVDENENLYLGGGDGLFLGADGGRSWSTAALPFEKLDVKAIAFDATPTGRVLAGTRTAGVFRTHDSGASWDPANAGLRASIVTHTYCDPAAAETVYAVSPPAKTPDGAASWMDFSQGLPDPDVYDLAISGGQGTDLPPTLFAVSPDWESGLYRRDDGEAAWTSVPFNPVPGAQSLITAVDVDPADRDRVIIGQAGLPAWVSYGEEPGGIFQTTDGGSTWSPLFVPHSPQYPNPSGIDFYQPVDIAIDPGDPHRIYVSSLWVEVNYTTWGWHVLRSTDGGASWQEVLSGSDYASFRYLVLEPNDPADVGTASAVYNYEFSADSTLRSLDGGNGWTSISGSSVAVDPELGGVIYSGLHGIVRMSEDRGDTWTPLPMNGFDNAIRSIRIAATSPRVIHVGTYAGVYSLKLVADEDGDGVVDDEDYCPGTVIPEAVPYFRLGVNHWALVDDDFIFDTTPPAGGGPELSFTTADTAGCSCEQIIEARGLGVGPRRLGCPVGVMQSWNPTVGDVPVNRAPVTVIESGDDLSVEPHSRRLRGLRRR